MIPNAFSQEQKFHEAKEKGPRATKKEWDWKNRADFYPRQMVGWRMQRVAVARSLINNPKILLADEPTANLDRASTNRVMDLFEEITESGVSVVVITHDHYVSERFRNVIEMSDGSISSKKVNKDRKKLIKFNKTI